jgi:glycosyltransferase involved in cell wall biosynthesis
MSPFESSITTGGLTRMDTHCHSWASDGPAVAALSFLEMPECYSPPEKVYDQARARGMDLVTITDHDTIRGAMELVDRGFQGFLPGQEVTVHFPEDRCKLHVLVWGLSGEHDEQLSSMGLRDDVYAFANWLHEHQLAHALAHPLYMQNGRLTRWHIERCALLFKGFELLNGAHTDRHRSPLDRFLDGLTPGRVRQLVAEHGIEPVWPRVWQKARTGGSDDHGLLNVGRAWTGVCAASGAKIEDPAEFFRLVMAGRCEPGGVGGHGSLLAHQLTTVGAHYYADRVASKQNTRGRYVASKLLRFAGVELPRPSKARLAAHLTTRKVLRRKRGKGLPLLDALREALTPVLERYPDLHERLAKERWDEGSALSDHERMAEFADELTAALVREMSGSSMRVLRKRDKTGLVDHVLSYGILTAAQLPYVFSLFYQNKEREFVERFEHETSVSGGGDRLFDRPMRVSLFTDTLGDVNGVSRFIGDVANRANSTRRDLQVITSTRQSVPEQANVYNFDPVFATAMPRYEDLEMVLPPLVPILRHIDRHQPDCIHISTPGPVGLIGFIAAKMLRVPVLGVYHTDFPSYIDNLFEDRAFTFGCEKFMRFFYSPFAAVFTRSEEYVESLVRLGLERERCCALMPGFASTAFSPTFRDSSAWDQHEGMDAASVKVLYVGRVSVEKNLPFLAGVWKQAQQQLGERGLNAELVVVGDGPYREKMTKELRGQRAHFLGFRRGQELGTIYASADLFVFPSVTDTLGQVVLESQGSGLPVLVTDQGGPKEVVEDGRTGYVVPVTEPELWVERIVGMVADNDARRRMGAAAHESVQKYSLANSFEHFWEVHTRAWHEHLGSRGLRAGEPGDAEVEPQRGTVRG